MLLETLMKFSSRVAEQAKFRWLILISGRFWGSWSDFANMYNRCGPNLWQPSQPPKPNILTNWIYSSSFAVMQQSATEKERGRSGQFIKRELIFPKPFYFLPQHYFGLRYLKFGFMHDWKNFWYQLIFVMPNLNVTLSQPHVEDRKKVLMVEETIGHTKPSYLSQWYTEWFSSRMYFVRLLFYTDCSIRVTPGLYYSAAYIQIQIREEKGVIWRETRGSVVQICDICSSVSFKRKSDKTSLFNWTFKSALSFHSN